MKLWRLYHWSCPCMAWCSIRWQNECKISGFCGDE